MADLVLGRVTSIIDATLAKGISAATEQINLAVGWKKELERLRRKLEMIRDVLLDADEKQVRSEVVRGWLKQLRKVACDAEDVLDEVAYERLKRKMEIRGQMKKKVGSFFTLSNPIIFRLRMANKIKDLITSIDGINKEAREYNLQPGLAVSAPESRSNPQTAHHFLGYCSQVIGRKDDVSNLVNLLIDPSNKESFSVISVVGMGGLGKTTLVKSVEEDEKIKEHFGKIIPVCVSEDFDVKRILKDMLECLSKESYSLEGGSVIMAKIKEKLGDKNYLLILDDVWNENELMKSEELRGCLLEINKNQVSRVVVTTRSEKVASTMGTRPEHVYHLKELKHDECWSIIKQRVFGDSSVPDPELEKIGRQIAKKCRGVPLVANFVGASLSTRIDRREWSSVQNLDAWDSLKDDGTGKGILGVLQSSFDRLPDPALKQCFAFCSIFPKDFVYERDELVQLWMAGSFLQPSGGSSVATLEDIGGKYFDDLLSYSLFQEARRDSYGKIMSCKMHDLIHDLATSNSKSETLVLKAASRDNITHVRYLNLVDDMETMPGNFKEVAGKLHALFLKDDILCKLPECFKRLRILSLHGQYKFGGYCIEKLPTWIGKMKHLRFLDISGTRIKKLPQFIMKLYSLQTLRFENCYFIEKQPEGMENLVNLKHIYFTREKCMPVGIGGLANLQTLPYFFVGRQKGSRIEELGSLSLLRGRLVISHLEFVENCIEAKNAKLCEKARLHELVLKWGRDDNKEYRHDEEVLEGLQPPSNVRSLTIDNYGGEKCPSWMDCSFSELFSLNIMCCQKLKCIATMRGFSALQELYIKDCSELTGIGDDVSTSLTSLRRLIIKGCPELQTIGHSLSSLSCLEELEVKSCANLSLISSVDGFSSLENFTIEGSHGLVSLQTVLLSCTALRELHIQQCSELTGIGDDVSASLTSLRRLIIDECPKLQTIGHSLSSLSCLEELEVRNCANLSLISSVDGFSSLKNLTIKGSHGLVSLPTGLSSCTTLQKLDIDYCSELTGIGDDVSASLTSLRRLIIDDCPKLQTIGHSLSSLSCLEELEVSNCANLSLISSVDGFSSLKNLTIEGSHGLVSLPTGLSSCTALQELYIGDCSELIGIGDDVSAWLTTSLRRLIIVDCPSLQTIGYTLSSLTCLKELDLNMCTNLRPIPSIDGLSSLNKLTILGCDGLVSLPTGLSSLTALQELSISNCHNMISISEDLMNLHSLIQLRISHCKNLRCIPEEILGCLVHLQKLIIGGFSEELEGFPGLSSIQCLNTSLRSLILIGWKTLKYLPPQIQHLTSLRNLFIFHFNQVEVLPEWLGSLSSLQILCIRGCNNLKYLPNSAEAMQRLLELPSLDISGCSELEERFAKEKGPEFSRISHMRPLEIIDEIAEESRQEKLELEESEESE